MSSTLSTSQPDYRRLLWAFVTVCAGVFFQTLFLQSTLESQSTATTIFSLGLWERTVASLGGHFVRDADGQFLANVGFGRLIIFVATIAVLCWLSGAAWISKRTGQTWLESLIDWGLRGWLWWLLPGVWEFGRIAAVLMELESIQAFLLVTPPFWEAFTLAGWLATFLTLSSKPCQQTSSSLPEADLQSDLASANTIDHSVRIPRMLWIACGLFVVVFTMMNWQLYRGLLIPHGDSAMYEEHLWNLEHGKGFRSYLDPGLFLGEHLQVIHLLLIPLHLVWPSHMLLELCETLALAAGAIPIFWMTQRQTGNHKAGLLLAIAYLLYFPLQYVDIAVDLKTFRPIAFGVPLLLFALDQLERRRFGTMVVLLLLTLFAKEDYAIILAPLGLWIAVRIKAVETVQQNSAVEISPALTTSRWLGLAITTFATLYLILAVTVVIPYFRGGEAVHYTGYFSKFGESPGEIVNTMLTNPSLVLKQLLTVKTSLYALALLLPLGFVPLLSPGRLVVGLPLFVVLCLNQIAQDPRHHFHAPLVPVLFWAAATGLGRGGKSESRKQWAESSGQKAADRRQKVEGDASYFLLPFLSSLFLRNIVWTSALVTGFFFSLGPLGLAFWDAHSSWHWRNLYVPGKRAEMFTKVFETIPKEARVASTDFVHPRFTHHERSYDYSHYRRRVSGYELTVPADTDYIVIDTQHKYSDIKSPEDVREYREHPDRWELLPDISDGYFIVLKRISDTKRN